MRSKGKIPLHLEGMSQFATRLDAAIGLCSVFFGAALAICPAPLQSLVLYSTDVGSKPAGNAAERWPRG